MKNMGRFLYRFLLRFFIFFEKSLLFPLFVGSSPFLSNFTPAFSPGQPDPFFEHELNEKVMKITNENINIFFKENFIISNFAQKYTKKYSFGINYLFLKPS